MINYFDLGLNTGLEMRDIITEVFPSLKIKDYRCYGFEACKKFADKVAKDYAKNTNVQVIHRAISNTHGELIKLYLVDPRLQPEEVGMSIFRTKNNVTDNFEMVETIKFSNWLKDNVPSFKNDLNILKINIEGAEFYFFKDLVENNLLQYFPIMIGHIQDVDKVSELNSRDYWDFIQKNNIKVFRYCSDLPKSYNVNIASLVAPYLKL